MSFLRYFNDNVVELRLVDKRRSWVMRLASACLAATNWLGLTAIEDFYGRWVTTSGRAVYASPAWTLDDPASPLVVHELTHVMQRGLWHPVRYLLCRGYRAAAEVDAVTTVMACFAGKRTEEYVRRKADSLAGYWLDREAVLRALEGRRRLLSSYQDPLVPQLSAASRAVVVAFFEWRALPPEELRASYSPDEQ